jgi:hypothetical protein
VLRGLLEKYVTGGREAARLLKQPIPQPSADRPQDYLTVGGFWIKKVGNLFIVLYSVIWIRIRIHIGSAFDGRLVPDPHSMAGWILIRIRIRWPAGS